MAFSSACCIQFVFYAMLGGQYRLVRFAYLHTSQGYRSDPVFATVTCSGSAAVTVVPGLHVISCKLGRKLLVGASAGERGQRGT